MRGEFVDVGGARLYYYAAGTRGAGEPLLLLHGFLTSSYLWHDVVPLVPPGHRVVVCDLLGYGRSDRPLGRDLSIAGHAGRVLALLDALRISYAAVAGHHLGGGIAQYLAVHHPTRVARLALVNSVAFDGWPSRPVRLARATLPLTRHLPGAWAAGFVRSELERGFGSEDHRRSVARYVRPFCRDDGLDVLLQHLDALNAAETGALAPRLRDIVAPTLVVASAQDAVITPGLAGQLQRAIPSATLETIPAAGHLSPEEAPAVVGAAFAEWLQR